MTGPDCRTASARLASRITNTMDGLPSSSSHVADSSTATQVLRLYNALDDYDDSQHVFANFDIPDEILETVEL